MHTCVWDVSSPFKIVLVNASKVNAEETAKVNAPSVSRKHSFSSPDSYNLSGKDADPGSVLLPDLLLKASLVCVRTYVSNNLPPVY